MDNFRCEECGDIIHEEHGLCPKCHIMYMLGRGEITREELEVMTPEQLNDLNTAARRSCEVDG